MKLSIKICYFIAGIGFIFLFSPVSVSGQDTVKSEYIYPSGLTVKYGSGSYSIKDEYISKEKYSGRLPYFYLGWARQHEKYVYNLDMTYRMADVSNYNVSTNITQFNLNQGFLYSLNKKSLFGKDLNIWLGPSAELWFLYNDPDFAISGFEYTQSVAALFSLGLNAEAIYSLSSRLSFGSSFRMTALSLGFRIVDMEEDDQSPVALLTPFSGMNSSFSLGLRYFILKRMSVKLDYRFELAYISRWDPLIAASDNIIVGLTYRF